MTGDPPVGTEDVFPKSDPDETPEARQARLSGQTPMRPTGATDGTNAQDRADAIVRRESGVDTFADAEAEDRANEYQIEDYPGQDDPLSAAGIQRQQDDPLNDSPGQTAARGINDFVRGAERLVDGDADADPRPRR